MMGLIMNAILTLINADMCKNVSTHSNVFINTFYARGPLDLLTNGRIPIQSIVKNLNILKAKSNFTLLLYIPFLSIGEWYFKCV